MTMTKHRIDLTESASLDLALRRLVLAGELSNDQARSVQDAYRLEVGPPADQLTVIQEPEQRSLSSKLAELGGYLGAALMAAAGAVAIGQRWSDMNQTGQVTLLLALAVAFGVGGGVIVALARSREPTSTEHAVLRRLASTLLTLSAASAAGGVMVAVLPSVDPGIDQIPSDVGRALVAAAAVSLVILVVARLVAPSALPEMAMYAALLGAGGGVLFILDPATDTPIKMVLFGIGLSWALLATFTRIVTVPTLAAGLGLATAFLAANIGEDADSRNLFLSVLVAVGIVVYLARPRWPYVAVAMLSAVALTVSVLGNAFGAALALLAAGLVLLVFAGMVLLMQRRRKTPAGSRHH